MADPISDFRSAILSSLGFAPETIEPGQMQRFATSARRRDDAGWCKLFADLRGGVFGCMRLGLTESWSAVDWRAMTRGQRTELARHAAAGVSKREDEQRKGWAVNAGRITRLWSECVPVTPGDPVAMYLTSRGLSGVWPLPDVLRLHRALPYWDGAVRLGPFPAMVAPIVAPDGRVVALHRTYLTVEGRKAEVPTAKKLTATAGPLPGACIALWKPERGVIGVAEGIETALAASLASGVPTMAAYCANSLATWHWPAGVQRLVIFADADQAGREAAGRLRARALAAYVRCDVVTPSTDGVDWCDVWTDQQAVLAAERGAK